MSYDAPPPPPPPGQPGGYGAPIQRKTSQLAIWALVTGILGLCCGLLSIAALILGILGRREIKNSGGTVSGDGMAVAGIVLGAIGVIWLVVSLILNAAGVLDYNFYYKGS